MYGYPYGHGYAGIRGWPHVGGGWHIDAYGRWRHPQQPYQVPWPNYYSTVNSPPILSTAATSGCCGMGQAPQTGGYCGDQYGNRICALQYPERLGEPCSCYGHGNGYVVP